MARFDDLTATLLQMSLMQEETSTAMNEPVMDIPEEYKCSSDEDVDLSLLSVESEDLDHGHVGGFQKGIDFFSSHLE